MASRRRKRKRRRSLDTSKLTKRQARVRGKRGARTGGRKPRIRTASVSSIGGIIARTVLKSRIGKRLVTVARQQISRIPGLGRFARTTRAAKARSTGLISTTGKSLAVSRPSPTRAIAKRAAVIAAGGAAFEGGTRIIDAIAGGRDVARAIRGTRGRARGITFTPGTQVPTDSITHTWIANGVPFAQLADGRVMVRRKNGTIKIFRRPRPIVLGRNPTVRQLVRADKKIDSVLKLVRKRMPKAVKRHSQTHN